jgi:hypothetical protein
MNRIKFSHNYPKLWNQKEAFLVNIQVIDDNDLSGNCDLIEYDTKISEGNYYPLPKGKKLHLTFIGDKWIPFCTIRRFTEQKAKYYRELKGKYFKIVIEEIGDGILG